jgi:hypothetical protein
LMHWAFIGLYDPVNLAPRSKMNLYSQRALSYKGLCWDQGGL